MTPDQTDANMHALFSSIRSLLLVIGTVMAGKGLTDSGAYFWVETAAGSIMVVGPAVWGIYAQYQNLKKQRQMQVAAVTAGIRMTVAGKALAADGHTVITANDGTTPPLPVTPATAHEIISNFGPVQK